jgi:hypothetical protein
MFLRGLNDKVFTIAGGTSIISMLLSIILCDCDTGRSLQDNGVE